MLELILPSQFKDIWTWSLVSDAILISASLFVFGFLKFCNVVLDTSWTLFNGNSCPSVLARTLVVVLARTFWWSLLPFSLFSLSVNYQLGVRPPKLVLQISYHSFSLTHPFFFLFCCPRECPNLIFHCFCSISCVCSCIFNFQEFLFII